MKLSQGFFDEYRNFITPSEIIEFSYCKRFIYFMKCLGIEQHEENRYKVQVGREIHERRQDENSSYLRKKIGTVERMNDVSLVSRIWGIRGKVDEVHTLNDGTMAPLDYKFSKFDEKIYQTYKNQLILYALMIEEVFNKAVERGFLVYCRDGSRLVEVGISQKDKREISECVAEYKDVLNGYFPKGTRYKARCTDCCYKNICIG
ncbi:CRISPR-associated Cas4 family exonuclease [Anaerobacterium chartisolvens]|uniref:CRISPR-associated exonuclease Cas4 n=1 Tax=Anaerobacterium chartisolvens TaxID=1297424 RepID=A0A369B3Y4_9FIRM|nr:CRISPR-associated protein Cas4 [Anaerobacterium chartisolvens]RCX16260.1 CRISPR-associated Cas4 family exonuclease [Anaerobacterium chartisolvens]